MCQGPSGSSNFVFTHATFFSLLPLVCMLGVRVPWVLAVFMETKIFTKNQCNTKSFSPSKTGEEAECHPNLTECQHLFYAKKKKKQYVGLVTPTKQIPTSHCGTCSQFAWPSAINWGLWLATLTCKHGPVGFTVRRPHVGQEHILCVRNYRCRDIVC